MSNLVSIFLVLFSLSPLSPTKADTNLVDSICKETVNYTKCLEAFESDPRSKNANDLSDLAKSALELAISNAKDSQDFINSMMKSIDGPVRQVLQNCAFWYKAVVGSFTSALLELEEDVMSANYDVKIAGDDADFCENTMALKKIEIPSLSDRNYQVKLYSDIGDVITSKL